MRTLRLILAVLVMACLTISGGDCPCCNAAQKCATDTCMLACYNLLALSVEGPPLIKRLPKSFVAIGSATLSPFSARPDPPPPRS